VASRVQTAVTMRQVTGSMMNVVKGMDQAMKAMDLEKVCTLSLGCSPRSAYTHTCPLLFSPNNMTSDSEEAQNWLTGVVYRYQQ
jgi:hypothetical protein